MGSNEYDTRKAFADYLEQFKDGLLWIRFNCQRIKFFIFPDEDTYNAFVEFVNEVSSSAERAESQLLRAQKWIPTDKMLDLSHDVIRNRLIPYNLIFRCSTLSTTRLSYLKRLPQYFTIQVHWQYLN